MALVLEFSVMPYFVTLCASCWTGKMLCFWSSALHSVPVAEYLVHSIAFYSAIISFFLAVFWISVVFVCWYFSKRCHLICKFHLFSVLASSVLHSWVSEACFGIWSQRYFDAHFVPKVVMSGHLLFLKKIFSTFFYKKYASFY